MSVHLIITFDVRHEARESFLALMGTVKAELPKVPGCEGVRVLRGDGAPLVFTLVETWRDKEIHQAHVRRLVDSGQWTELTKHLASDPTSAYYEEL